MFTGGMFCSGMDLSVVAQANETGYMDWCDAEQRGPMVGCGMVSIYFSVDLGICVYLNIVATCSINHKIPLFRVYVNKVN